MVAKSCSRSQGQPEPGVRSAAMIASRRAMSREGVAVVIWLCRSLQLGLKPRKRVNRSLESVGIRKGSDHRVELVLLASRVMDSFRLSQRKDQLLDRLLRQVRSVAVASFEEEVRCT